MDAVKIKMPNSKVVSITNEFGDTTNHFHPAPAFAQFQSGICADCGIKRDSDMLPVLLVVTSKRLDIECWVCPDCMESRNN